MKKLYLHIGLSKTGSSALQSWFSLNTKLFEKQGFDYADLNPLAKKGKITAGNGVVLFNACKDENFSEIERLITNIYFQSNEKAIISSETLQNISPVSIAKLKEVCDKHSITVVVIAYVRSAYELLYSNYLQGIKRHGFTFKFGKKGNFSYSKQTEFLKNYFDVFKDSVIVKNYDYEKKDIFSSFANLIGFDNKKAKIKDRTVNRSLTHNEAEVLRKLNAIHKGIFSTELSDYLIAKSPNKTTTVYYNEELVNKVINNCADDLRWINTHLLVDSQPLLPCLSPLNTGNGESGNDSLDNVYQVVIEWCLNSSKTNQDKGFVEFLRDLAVSFEKSNVHIAYELMKRAHKLRPNGPFIANRVVIYEEKLKRT